MNDTTNPLNYSPKKQLAVLNKSGRPTKENVIKFGPQPQSFISQLLRKQKKVTIEFKNTQTSSKSKLTEEDAPTIQDNTSSDEENPPECDPLSETDTLTEDSNIGKINAHHQTLTQNIPTECGATVTTKEKLYTCNYMNCTYSTRISSNLSKHKRTHTSEKPYLCDICSFQTKFVNSLKTHKRIHTNIRPYICIICSYRCNSSSNLKKHCKHMHSNKELKT